MLISINYVNFIMMPAHCQIHSVTCLPVALNKANFCAHNFSFSLQKFIKKTVKNE